MKPSFVFAVLLFLFLFAGCSQRYFFRPKVRVQTSKFSEGIKGSTPLEKPKFAQPIINFRFAKKGLETSAEYPRFKNIVLNKSNPVKLPKVLVSQQKIPGAKDSTDTWKDYRRNVLLNLGGVVTIIGGLAAATTLGFIIALLGFSMIIFALYLREKSKPKVVHEPRNSENYTTPEKQRKPPKLVSKEKGDNTRFGIVIGLLIILISAFILILLSFFTPFIALLFIGILILIVSPTLVYAAKIAQTYTAKESRYHFYEIAKLIGIIGVICLLIGVLLFFALAFGEVAILFFFLLTTLAFFLPFWFWLRTTFKSRRQLRAEE
jgi:hypothetical protein